tara:strand:- start:5419 stop:6294 length:876 start_codon:yes stop_codon:yes gene_type:complete
MISIASFCVGKSYDQIRSKLTKKITPTDTALRSNQNACQVEKINKIPENSYIIIGHAYGSHEGSAQRNHEGIAPSIKTLIKYNKSRISGIIFTGDVLSVPSEKKWRDLHQLTQPIPVYIAPGNHDVSIIQDSASRDIFNKRSTAQSLIYPQSIMIDEALFIIDDSNPRNSSEKLGSYIVSEIKKRPSISNAIVVRHHVLPEELRYAQNGESPSKYWSANEFSIIRQQLPESTELSFIYGDGGAFTRLPRMSCTSISGFKNIVNGIGELKDDRILIYNEGKLSYYVLGRTGF